MKSINSLPELSLSLIVDQILKDAGQLNLAPIDLKQIDELLKLVSYDFDFNHFKGEGLVGEQLSLRGILDIKERSIYLDENENYEPRKRFSHAHEVGHYLIPHHRDHFYRCNEQDMKHHTDHMIEREANEFASALLFKGSAFDEVLDAYDIISFNSACEIADQFNVSNLAAARKLVTDTLHPAALVVISADENNPAIKYTITSQTMREKYLKEITSIPSISEVVQESRGSSRNDPYRSNFKLKTNQGESVVLECQFYYNGYDHLGIVTPKV